MSRLARRTRLAVLAIRPLGVPAVLAFAVLATFTTLALAFLAYPAAAASIQDPGGPLAEIHVSRVHPLDCQVMHVGVDYDAPGSESDGEFWGWDVPYAANACGTFLRLGTTTYGPSVGGFAGYPPTNPLPTSFTPLSQSKTGAGTAADPWTITTEVRAGTLGSPQSVHIRQVDTYASGQLHYTTAIEVTNEGLPTPLVLYRGGDCYLTPVAASGDSSDKGFGWRDPATGAVACAQLPMASSGRLIGWIPESSTVGPPKGFEGDWDVVWAYAGHGVAYPDTCLCLESVDNGAGLSWSLSLATGGTATIVHRNLFSSDGLANVTLPDSGDVVFPTGPSGPSLPYPEPPASDEHRGDRPPVARFTPYGTCGDWHIDLDASASHDVDGLVVDWQWDLPGTQAEGRWVRHNFGEPGLHPIRLTVTDDRGLSSSYAIRLALFPCQPLRILPVEKEAIEGERVHACAFAYGGSGAYTFSALLEGSADLPIGATFDSTRGCLAWTAVAGDHCFRVTVRTDDEAATECMRFVVRPAPVRGQETPDSTDVPDQPDGTDAHSPGAKSAETEGPGSVASAGPEDAGLQAVPGPWLVALGILLVCAVAVTGTWAAWRRARR